MSEPVPADRPRIVDAAFLIWVTSSIALVALGLLLALSEAPLPAFYRGVGALFALSGLALGYLAGRARSGDPRFRLAAVGLALAVVVVLALFSIVSQGLLWLFPLILAMVGAVLIMRPAAQPWFDRADGRT